ncbi:hypothetical protein DITRI_Ditri03aG0152300 [Diplodiscus trichospermus]
MLIVYRNAIAALVLAPFALVFERPIVDQGFAYLGMKFTLFPLTFGIAIIFRLDQVKIKQVRRQAKVIGTLLILSGALLMTLYKGPVIDLIWSRKTIHYGSSSESSDKHWIPGTLLVFLGCVAWSCFYALQSITIKKYPAEISLSSLICLAGAIQSLAIALVVEHHPSRWAVGWNSRLLAPLYLGIVSSGITYYVQGQVMKTRGPVFVTAFNPLCMIIVAVLGSVILGEQIHLGSIIGGIIIAIGL